MKKLLLAAAAIVAMGSATIAPAVAAPGDRYEQSRRGDDRNDNRRGDESRRDGRGEYQVGGHRYERQRGPAWHAPRGYQHRNWSRGQRLPSDYRQTRIGNYRAYHLNAPPRGYQYVRVNNDAVLVAVTSGIIAAVIANAFY